MILQWGVLPKYRWSTGSSVTFFSAPVKLHAFFGFQLSPLGKRLLNPFLQLWTVPEAIRLKSPKAFPNLPRPKFNSFSFTSNFSDKRIISLLSIHVWNLRIHCDVLHVNFLSSYSLMTLIRPRSHVWSTALKCSIQCCQIELPVMMHRPAW